MKNFYKSSTCFFKFAIISSFFIKGKFTSTFALAISKPNLDKSMPALKSVKHAGFDFPIRELPISYTFLFKIALERGTLAASIPAL